VLFVSISYIDIIAILTGEELVLRRDALRDQLDEDAFLIIAIDHDIGAVIKIGRGRSGSIHGRHSVNGAMVAVLPQRGHERFDAQSRRPCSVGERARFWQVHERANLAGKPSIEGGKEE